MRQFDPTENVVGRGVELLVRATSPLLSRRFPIVPSPVARARRSDHELATPEKSALCGPATPGGGQVEDHTSFPPSWNVPRVRRNDCEQRLDPGSSFGAATGLWRARGGPPPHQSTVGDSMTAGPPRGARRSKWTAVHLTVVG